MQLKCAVLVALFVLCAAMLSAGKQSSQGLVSAADDTVNRVRPLRGVPFNTERGEPRKLVTTGTPPAPTPGTRQMSTPVPTLEADCNWMWAYRELPEITIQVSSALDAAGIPYSNVSAQTLGEDCLSRDGEAQYFTPMETDYEITIPVRSLADREALGDQAAAVLFLLNYQFPPDSTPGPIAGKVKLTFSARGETLRLIIHQEEAEDVLSSNLRGSALLATLDD